MQTFLAVTPDLQRSAIKHTKYLAHVAYRVGEGSTLLRQDLQSRGGLLHLSDLEAPPIADPGALAVAVVRECHRRNFSGVVLDFEEAATADRHAFVSRLSRELGQRRLFLPQSYAADAPGAVMLLGSAVSGGDFREYLKEWTLKRSGGKLALDVERLRMDFRLPSPSGTGTPLSAQELQKRLPPVTFFSPELCARYFTYIRDQEPHFVLYDDAETLNRKVRIAGELGFAAAFFMWPEVEDIAGKIRWA